jgi:hypothetical protein
MQTDPTLAFDVSNLFGWLASTFMLATFSSDSQRVMRLLALAANLCFIVYGTLNSLMPVVVLHVLLFPINLRKLMTQEGASNQIGKPSSCESEIQK